MYRNTNTVPSGPSNNFIICATLKILMMMMMMKLRPYIPLFCSCDLDIWTWPIYSVDVPATVNWTVEFHVSYHANRMNESVICHAWQHAAYHWTLQAEVKDDTMGNIYWFFRFFFVLLIFVQTRLYIIHRRINPAGQQWCMRRAVTFARIYNDKNKNAFKSWRVAS